VRSRRAAYYFTSVRGWRLSAAGAARDAGSAVASAALARAFAHGLASDAPLGSPPALEELGAAITGEPQGGGASLPRGWRAEKLHGVLCLQHLALEFPKHRAQVSGSLQVRWAQFSSALERRGMAVLRKQAALKSSTLGGSAHSQRSNNQHSNR